MAAPIRTRFEPGGMRRSAIWRGLLVALGGVVLGVVLWIAGSVVAGVGLIAIGLVAGAITGYGLLTSLRPVTLVLSDAGIDVTVSGRPFSLACSPSGWRPPAPACEEAGRPGWPAGSTTPEP